MSTPEQLVIRAWRPIEQIGFAVLWIVLVVAAATNLRHRGEAQTWVFLVILGAALWRMTRNSVVVSQSGLLYRGFRRDHEVSWSDIGHFGYSTNGVTVYLKDGKSIWLLPTKSVRANRDTAVADAEAAMQSIVEYAPKEDGFALRSPAR